jgi:hypothetical protein
MAASTAWDMQSARRVRQSVLLRIGFRGGEMRMPCSRLEALAVTQH